jgi:ABC-type amino acid transport substrate-binding protein
VTLAPLSVPAVGGVMRNGCEFLTHHGAITNAETLDSVRVGRLCFLEDMKFAKNERHYPKWIVFILLILLTTTYCQPTPEPTLQPTTPPPTPLLIPPVQRGDGSDLMDRLLDTGVIRVGVRVWPEASFSPPAFRGFSNAEIGGALNGFEVDVARQVAEGLGLELELVEAYPPVIASGDWRGQWDIAIASLTPFDQPQDRPKHKLVFSKPYGYMPVGFLIPATSKLQTLDDLSDQRVGVLEHSVYQELLASGGSPLTVEQKPLRVSLPAETQPVPVANLPKAIRQLGEADSDLDAIFGPTPVLQEAIKSDLPVKLLPQAENVSRVPLAIAAIPQDDLKVDRLIFEINKVIDRLRRHGTLAEIYLRWYGQDFSQAED